RPTSQVMAKYRLLASYRREAFYEALDLVGQLVAVGPGYFHHPGERALEVDAITVLRGGVDENRLLGQRAAGYRHPAGHLPRVVLDSTNDGARDGAAHGISRRRDRFLCSNARTVPRAGSAHDVPAPLAGTLPARRTSSRAAYVPPVDRAAGRADK